VQSFLFAQYPVKKAEITIRDVDPSGLVNCVIKRELHSFNYMESDSVLEASGWKLA
jgi:hypothetical protein